MSVYNRVGVRRRRDLVMHLKIMELQTGFEKGLPYEVLWDKTKELGKLAENYNDEDRENELRLRNTIQSLKAQTA